MRFSIIMTILAALLAMALVSVINAAGAAEVCSYVSRPYQNTWTGDIVYRRTQVCRHVHHEPRYYSAPRRDYDDDPRWRDRGSRNDLCLQKEVDVLSTEHQSEDNAREAARKLWMSKTQWEHGSQWMDLDEAAHIRWRCGPSNAHDTAAGRLSEAAGVLTGKGGQNVRCALWARPCRVERSKDDIRGRK